MRVFALCASAFLAAAPVFAQDVQDAETGVGAVLRGLDRMDGQAADIEIPQGGQARMGRISIELAECRFPAGNPAGDAFAYLVIREDGSDAAIFEGWMVASSPALNAMDHARYDVWVMRCITPEAS